MTMTTEQIEAIRASRLIETPTLRATAPGLEQRLHLASPVLDHGFVRVVDYMGNDQSIVEAARVSYGTGTKAAKDDAGLIRYLMSHWHSTPFEMCEIKLHVKLPVFVARQWIRHRTANVNEYSARYSILDREFYIPHARDMAIQSSTNNQGRGEVLDAVSAKELQDWMLRETNKSYDNYLDILKPQDEGGEYGLARELARMNLPISIYTQWYWKVDLHNLFHFLRLRADPHAQFEIRAYADVICAMVKDWVPIAYQAFEDYRLNAVSFSAQEQALFRNMISGRGLADQPNSGLSKREYQAFRDKLGLWD